MVLQKAFRSKYCVVADVHMIKTVIIIVIVTRAEGHNGISLRLGLFYKERSIFALCSNYWLVQSVAVGKRDTPFIFVRLHYLLARGPAYRIDADISWLAENDSCIGRICVPGYLTVSLFCWFTNRYTVGAIYWESYGICCYQHFFELGACDLLPQKTVNVERALAVARNDKRLVLVECL